MKRNRKIKILVTLGPSSNKEKMIEHLFNAGADAFRINMSHTNHNELFNLHSIIRKVEKKVNHPIGILIDIQGPKLRIGSFKNNQEILKKGQLFKLDDNSKIGDNTRVFLPHPEILNSIKIGHKLLLNDGRIQLLVIHTKNNIITTKVLNDCTISNRKGINLPNTLLPVSSITKKDKNDINYAITLDIDFIALSFIQRASDIKQVQKIINNQIKIIAKIEKPSALMMLDEIIKVSDGIMVARGDLGVELPIEKVPGIQKIITRASRNAGIPVIIATQMLESMIKNPVPTRAEVSDVATAVYEGADAVMLSAESAIGNFPIESVKMMNRIANEAEIDPFYPDIIYAHRTETRSTSSDVISAAIYNVAKKLKISLIVCYTTSGATANRVSRRRPQNQILTLSPNINTARNLSLTWGIYCLITNNADKEEILVDYACKKAFEQKLVKIGDKIVISAGIPFGRPGTTNMLRIASIGKNGICGD